MQLQPFLEESSVFAKAFPPKHLATSVPLYAALAITSLVVFNIGWSLVYSQVEAYRTAQKEKAESAKKAQ